MPLDPLVQVKQQFLQRQAYRVRKAPAHEQRAAGADLLKRLILHLESKVGRDGMGEGQREA